MRIAKLVFIPLLLLILAHGGLAQSSFVRTLGHAFEVNGKPYYFVGTNYWYGSLLGIEKDEKRGLKRLRKELDFLKANGVTNLRLLGGAEGSGLISGVIRVGPPLQPTQRQFNDDVLKGLDSVLAEMGKRGMKGVIFISNNWEWSGGFQQYLIWNGLVPKDQETRKLTAKLTCHYLGDLFILRDTAAARAMIGHKVTFHTDASGCVEIRAGGNLFDYTTQRRMACERPVEVDSKTILSAAQAVVTKRRERHRQPTAAQTAKGVKAAKSAASATGPKRANGIKSGSKTPQVPIN